jgi:hypothetical protein
MMKKAVMDLTIFFETKLKRVLTPREKALINWMAENSHK